MIEEQKYMSIPIADFEMLHNKIRELQAKGTTDQIAERYIAVCAELDQAVNGWADTQEELNNYKRGSDALRAENERLKERVVILERQREQLRGLMRAIHDASRPIPTED